MAGMATGDQYFKRSGRPHTTQVVKVMEGAETALFKAKFVSWPPAGKASVDFSQPYAAQRRIAATKTALSSSDLAASLVTARDAGKGGGGGGNGRGGVGAGRLGGSVKAWRVEGFREVEVAPERLGQFYAGDAYLVRHKYKEGVAHHCGAKDNKEQHRHQCHPHHLRHHERRC